MKTLVLVCFTAILILAAGCDGMVKGKGAAEAAAGEFHRQFNEGKFTEIHAAAHAKFKAVGSEKKFVELSEAVSRKLGKVTATKTVKWNVRSLNLVTTVVMQQQTTFEHGTGLETFSFQMDGAKAVLLGYNINSNELILK